MEYGSFFSTRGKGYLEYTLYLYSPKPVLDLSASRSVGFKKPPVSIADVALPSPLPQGRCP